METDTSASGKKEGAIVGQPGAIWIASSGPGAERLLSEAAIPRNVAFVYLEPKIASVENSKLGACAINRPCAQQYVGKYQSCIV